MLNFIAVILPFLFATSSLEIGVLVTEGIAVIGAGVAIGVLDHKIRKKSESDVSADSAVDEEETIAVSDADKPEISSEEVVESGEQIENYDKNSSESYDVEKEIDEIGTKTDTENESDMQTEFESDENCETETETVEEKAVVDEKIDETESETVYADREETIVAEEKEVLSDSELLQAYQKEMLSEDRSESAIVDSIEDDSFGSDASELKAFVAACSAAKSDEKTEQFEEAVSSSFDLYEKTERTDENNAESFSKYGSNETNELKRHIRESMAASRMAAQNVEKYDWNRIKEYNTAIMPIATFGKSDEEDDGDDDKPGGARLADDIIFSNGTDVMAIRYRKSFKAKLIQSDDIVKDYYLIVRAALFRYKKIRRRECFSRENYYVGRINVAKLAIRGKTLVLYLALNPEEFVGKKYRFKDLSDKKRYSKTPFMVRITSTRAARWACELIDSMLNDNIYHDDYQPDHSTIPFERTSALLKKGLIRAFTPDGKIELTEYILTQLESVDGSGRNVSVYKQSFAAKIIRADKTLQNYYSEIKNELLSYKKVKERSSWNAESFYVGRTTKAKLTLRGKTLTLFLALDPKDYVGTKYHARDFSHRKKYAATPVAVKIKSGRGLKFACELVSFVFADHPKTESAKVDYTSDFKDTGALLREGLVKKIK